MVLALRVSRTFAEAAALIEPGESVQVTLDRGQVAAGNALDVTPTSLTITSRGGTLTLDEPAVIRVRQRWDDPLMAGEPPCVAGVLEK